MNLSKFVIVAKILVFSVGAYADLPTDQEYLALHMAASTICPSLFPGKAIQIGAAVMMCDMTDSTDERKAVYQSLIGSDVGARVISKMEELLKKDLELTRKFCDELARYPNPGQFCILTSDSSGRAKATLMPPTERKH